MNKVLGSIFALMAILLFVSPTDNVKADSNNIEVEIYDEEDNLIETISYNPEEINLQNNKETHNDQFSINSTSIYPIGSTSFSNFVWVNSGNYFQNPGIMDFELINRPEEVAVEVYKTGQVYAGKAVWRNVAGWVSLDWRDTTLVSHPGSYAFRFKNDGAGSVSIKHGNLYYNY